MIEENHMYIRIASNDFFSISRDVVSKMISGEYNAEQAYQSFNTQLLEEKSTSEDIVLDSKKTYSNRFHTSGNGALPVYRIPESGLDCKEIAEDGRECSGMLNGNYLS